ncbi:hypothetical protein B0T26DRAFT_675590 [Lasiosphaeria miniovina]|uniref:Uncharacterized protein n=1 Tax=Lasiosphaeria miniovina TaxID=1954250 RepID=A0AA40DZK8_9PEZI|nr:uncharacterized protein B0T26DRAFT_675590 [Lasiosphaeria miniovina]KAK0717258.1 hypothetical protein B0T26DRAFT_675590 [Lasiosphaeria miniovina]
MGDYYVYESDRPTRRRRYRLVSSRASRYPPPEEDYDYDGDYYYESSRESRRAPPPADYEYDIPRSRRESSRPRPRARTPARATDYRRRSSRSRSRARDRERERDSDEYRSRSRRPAQNSYEYERNDEGVQSKRYYNVETGRWAGTDFFVDGKLVDRMDRSADSDLLETLEKIRIKEHEEGEKRIGELKKEIEDLNNY